MELFLLVTLMATICSFVSVTGNTECWDISNSRYYNGTKSTSSKGKTCQAWNSQYPHAHGFDADENFPADGSTAAASNYCRDPNNSGYLWCITTDPSYPYDVCDFAGCSDAGSCWDGIDPHYFNGVVAVTRNGYTCQHWTTHVPHPHDYDVDENFPADGSVLAAGNNCRDPDSNGYIWCYTMDEFVRWDYCDFPPCSEPTTTETTITTDTSYCWDGGNTRDYSGVVDVTQNGYECQHWISQVPHVHSYGVDVNFPMDGSVLAAENYCRDPGRDGDLWCFTLDENVQWDYCDVPQCIEPTTTLPTTTTDTNYCWDGVNTRDYSGVVDVTQNGYECQHWISQVPHVHSYGVDVNFPLDGSVLAAENYCRDPGSDGDLWCFTLDENVPWDYCDVPQCIAIRNCLDGSDTRGFNGVIAATQNGDACQDWNSRVPHDHGYGLDENFPMDGSVLAAKNYCRDPGSDGYLWCYTLDENTRWDYCYVPQCSDTTSTTTTTPESSCAYTPICVRCGSLPGQASYCEINAIPMSIIVAYRFSSVSCIYYGSSPDGSYSEAPGGMFSSNGCDALFDVCAWFDDANATPEPNTCEYMLSTTVMPTPSTIATTTQTSTMITTPTTTTTTTITTPTVTTTIMASTTAETTTIKTPTTTETSTITSPTTTETSTITTQTTTETSTITTTPTTETSTITTTPTTETSTITTPTTTETSTITTPTTTETSTITTPTTTETSTFTTPTITETSTITTPTTTETSTIATPTTTETSTVTTPTTTETSTITTPTTTDTSTITTPTTTETSTTTTPTTTETSTITTPTTTETSTNATPTTTETPSITTQTTTETSTITSPSTTETSTTTTPTTTETSTITTPTTTETSTIATPTTTETSMVTTPTSTETSTITTPTSTETSTITTPTTTETSTITTPTTTETSTITSPTTTETSTITTPTTTKTSTITTPTTTETSTVTSPTTTATTVITTPTATDTTVITTPTTRETTKITTPRPTDTTVITTTSTTDPSVTTSSLLAASGIIILQVESTTSSLNPYIIAIIVVASACVLLLFLLILLCCYIHIVRGSSKNKVSPISDYRKNP